MVQKNVCLIQYTYLNEEIKIMTCCPHINYLLIMVTHVIVICPRVANSLKIPNSLALEAINGTKDWYKLCHTFGILHY